MTPEQMMIKALTLGMTQCLFNQQILLVAGLKHETDPEFQESYQELIKQTGDITKMLRESAKITGSIMDT